MNHVKYHVIMMNFIRLMMEASVKTNPECNNLHLRFRRDEEKYSVDRRHYEAVTRE